MCGRIERGRKNGRDWGQYQKRGRNNEQIKIWNIYAKYVKENAIRIVLFVPLKHLVELYQKYKPKSEVHLMDKSDLGREAIHAEDIPQLDTIH